MIVNADDLGMTPGTNRAIFEGNDRGAITHTSVMANGDYFDEAMDGMASRESLGLGIHLNLSYGKALIDNPLYCNDKGLFNLGYGALLTRRDDTLLLAIEKEFEAQIKHVLERRGVLTHLDSHRHIHLIPHIYPIVVKLAEKYQIPRVRLINENLLASMKLTGRVNFFFNGGIIKYLLLRTFSLIDMKKADLYQNIRFYSILYTGVVGADILRQLGECPDNYEIMVHPGYPEIDRDIFFYDPDEKAYRVSDDRKKELETVLSIPKGANGA